MKLEIGGILKGLAKKHDAEMRVSCQYQVLGNAKLDFSKVLARIRVDALEELSADKITLDEYKQIRIQTGRSFKDIRDADTYDEAVRRLVPSISFRASENSFDVKLY